MNKGTGKLIVRSEMNKYTGDVVVLFWESIERKYLINDSSIIRYDNFEKAKKHFNRKVETYG
jgi:hypothetical protein